MQGDEQICGHKVYERQLQKHRAGWLPFITQSLVCLLLHILRSLKRYNKSSDGHESGIKLMTVLYVQVARMREIRALQRLSPHPNIIKLQEVI